MKTGAQRQKLKRERDRLELIYAPSWAPLSLVEFLVNIGALTAEQADVPAERGKAVVKWAIECAGEALLRGRNFP